MIGIQVSVMNAPFNYVCSFHFWVKPKSMEPEQNSWDIVYRWNDDTELYDQVDYLPTIWACKSKVSSWNKKKHIINSCVDLKEGEFVWCKVICKRSGITNLRRIKASEVKAQYTSNLNITDFGWMLSDLEIIRIILMRMSLVTEN